MSNDLFQADQSDVVAVEKKFEDLVGEGKKYSDNEAVAKAIEEKDRFIEQLKREAQEAREAAKTRLNEDQFLDKLETRLKAQSLQVAPQEDPAGQGVHTGVTPEDVVKVIEEREAVKRREANLGSVSQRLQATYGSDWKYKVSDLARQLGVSTQYLTNLAADSPQLFFNAIGVKEQPQLTPDRAPPRSAIATPVVPSSGAKDYAYWQAQKKEKGDNWYFSTSVQQQVWKEVKSQGEDNFYARSNS